MMAAKTITYQHFLGIRNAAQSRLQPKVDANGARVITLARANNVDIDDEGGILRRDGYTLALAATGITASYAMMDGRRAYFVDDGMLKLVDENMRVMDVGMVSVNDTYWTEVGNMVFMSTGQILDNDQMLDWRVQPPVQPSANITGGNLLAGKYQIVITRQCADGREGPSSAPVTTHVPDSGGIVLSGTSGCNVYCTKADGTVFYFVGNGAGLVAGDGFFNSPIDPPLFLASALPDSIGQVAHFNDCIYYSKYDRASDTTEVGWSAPYYWHIFNPFLRTFTLPGEVRTLHGMEDYLLICTEREILAYDGSNIAVLAKYGVPRGRCLSMARDKSTYLQTDWGMCALPFANLTMDKVILPVGEYCNTALLFRDGTETFVTLSDGTGKPELSTIF